MEDVRRGVNRRLIVNLPPRNLKSIMVSVAFAAWVLGHDSTKRILAVSYGQDLAEKLARDCRTIIETAWYQRLFPNTRIAPGQNRVDDFRTTERGGRKSQSILGGVTGFGADFILIDDPMQPSETFSDGVREKANEMILASILSRQEGVGTAGVVLAQQRLHEEDTTGFLEKRGAWLKISLPAIAEEAERYEYRTPFGSAAFERAEGDVLNPTYESRESLVEQIKLIGDYFRASQYQQRPALLGGGHFKPAWFVQVAASQFPTDFEMIVQSWDTGIKDGPNNDFSVCTTFGVLGEERYLIDVFRQKLEAPPLLAAIKRLREKFRPNALIIEEGPSGTPILQQLKKDMVFESMGVRPVRGKIARAQAQTPQIEGGAVRVPVGAPWLADFFYELSVFPRGRHDDQVDSLTQALAWITEHQTMPGIWHFYREEAQVARKTREPVETSPTVRMAPTAQHDGSALHVDGVGMIRCIDGAYDVPRHLVEHFELLGLRRIH